MESHVIPPARLQLLEEALAIEAEDAKQAGALGYMARVLAQVSMPYRKREGNEFTRTNGAISLTILAPSQVGLPYGTIPRLVLSWLTTEAVRTKEPRIVLGATLSSFMRELDMLPTGGRWGSITRLRDQLRRLFASTISCNYEEGTAREGFVAGVGMQIAKSYRLWWHPRDPHQAGLWESEVILSRDFFEEVIHHPVPIDLRALKSLRKSPLGLDLYVWLTYRMSYLHRPTTVPWEALRLQFGSDFLNPRHFKAALKRALQKVMVVYPQARIEAGRSGLVLQPSPPHVPKRVH